MRGNAGINRLAKAIDGRAKERAQRPNELELGAIQDDKSLLLDRFAVPIPPSDYLVSGFLTISEDFITTTELQSGAHSQYQGDGAHDHQIVTPEQFKPLKAGDRVLVAWVNDGTDPVVLCRVVSGDA